MGERSGVLMTWTGDPEGHSRAGRARKRVYTPEYMADIGRRGGSKHSVEHMKALSAKRKCVIDKIQEAVSEKAPPG